MRPSHQSLLERAAILLVALAPTLAPAQVAHDLQVKLSPSAHAIEVVDTITLPEAGRSARIVLHGNLNPEIVDEETTLRPIGRDESPSGVPLA